MRLVSLAASALLFASAASAQTLDRIKSSGELKIGFRSDAAPMSFVDDTGRPSGYTPLVCDRLAQAIADKLQMDDLKATFLVVEPTDRFDKVASGDIDLLCGAATITLSRREKVDFSIPIYVDGTAVLLPKDASSDFNQLAGKKIGVRSGTTTEEAVVNSFGAAGVETELLRFASHPDGINAMASGEIAAYFGDQSILMFNYAAAGLTQDFKISPEIMTIEKHGIALAKNDADFRLLIDTVLSEMYANGTMEEIFRTILPGAEPGAALKALYIIAPTLP